MSLLALVVTASFLWELVRRLLAISSPAVDRTKPRPTGESRDMVRLSRILAGTGVEPTEGHLLLALASRPGEHLKLLPDAIVLSCAVRVNLGLATRRHRLILSCDRPKLAARRCHLRIDREIAAHGRLSRWGVASVVYGGAGALFALAIFPVTVLATALLYLFLWPAALLMSGTRALCGAMASCEARSYHWLKIPGGDVALTPRSGPISPRATVAALVVPRLIAAAVCIVVMVALLWRSRDLGVVVSPVVFRRPDILTGAAPEAIWLGPLAIFAGFLEQNGTAAGIGLLAGLGAGVMSIPTFREIELIRLHAGHDIGRGSRLTRALTAPASVFTGAVSCIEAVLPITGSPIYVTVYLVPLLCFVLVAIALLQLTPF